MKEYPNLFSPIKIGSLTLKNRIEAAPIGIPNLTIEGYLTRENIAFYEMRAKGGAAIVTIGESLVHSSTGKAHARMVPLYDEGIIPSLIDTTDAIKQHGAIASIQLMHAGVRSNPRYNKDGKVYGPSPDKCVYGGPVLEMDETLIEEIAEAYGDAAEMAKLAGVDMCMIHGGHGWLLAQFLSPYFNKRTDRFGGSLENRARITMMVIDNIRAKCGPDFPIEIRINGIEDGGITLDEATEFSKMLDGKVDLIHVSSMILYNREDDTNERMGSMFHPKGHNVFLAEAIKKEIKTPIATVGAINEPDHMEEIIASGKADIIVAARALLADPFLPEKARQNSQDDITPCLRCMHCISGSFVPYIKYPRLVLRCTVNPTVGKEFDSFYVQPASKPKKVMIAGGGPAGMQAAITAADRGHEVILCEKNSILGGTLLLAGQANFKTDLKKFTDLLVRRVSDRAIRVLLNTEVTPKLVKYIAPDMLIAAVGAEPIIPDIPGIDGKKVIIATDPGNKGIINGQKIVIVGGGLVGCEEGLSLARQGKDVTIIEQLEAAATDAPFLHWKALMIEINKSVKLFTKTTCKKITSEGVIATDANGKEKIFEADTVVVAVGVKPLSAVVENLRNCAPDYAVIGDCLKAGKVIEAIHGGYFTAMNI